MVQPHPVARGRLRRGVLALAAVAGAAYGGHALDIGQRVAQAFDARASQGGLVLDAYRARVQAREIEGVEKNLSGLAYDRDRGHLWAVVNSPPELLALAKDGAVLARYALEGFADVEAVASLGGGLLAVVEERRDALVVLPVPEIPAPIRRAGQHTVALDIGGGDNRGVEGMAYDAAGDRLFVVKERSPRRLVELPALRARLRGEGELEALDRSAWLGDVELASDLSSVEYDARSGHLVLLSDESKRLLELDRDGRMVGSRSLLAGLGGLRDSVPQAEGLAMDEGGTVYLVSEPNLFYVLEAPPPQAGSSDAAALGANR